MMMAEVAVMPVTRTPWPGVVTVNAGLVVLLIGVHRAGCWLIVIVMLDDAALNDAWLFNHRRSPFLVNRGVEIGSHPRL
jgi:hypothetical protein